MKSPSMAATQRASGSATCSRYRSATPAVGLVDPSAAGDFGITDAAGETLAVAAASDAVDAAPPQAAKHNDAPAIAMTPMTTLDRRLIARLRWARRNQPGSCLGRAPSKGVTRGDRP